MEDELETNFDNISSELIRGSGGVFEVKVDGKIVFSKNSGPNATYRFPDEGEITRLIKEM